MMEVLSPRSQGARGAEELAVPLLSQLSGPAPLLAHPATQPLCSSSVKVVEAQKVEGDAPVIYPALSEGEVSPKDEELRIIMEVERKMIEHGWHSCSDTSVPPGTKLRCKNCGNFFAEAEKFQTCPSDCKNGEEVTCQYHPGRYRRSGTTISTGMYVGWSCCKAIDEDTPGCKLKTGHVEDKETTMLLKQMSCSSTDSELSKELERRLDLIAQGREEELDEVWGEYRVGDTASEILSQISAEDGEPSSDKEQDKAKDTKAEAGWDASKYNVDENGNLVHNVSRCDTIQGLSLRYGVSTQRIKEVNGILGSSIIQYSALLIPPTEEGKVQKRKKKTAISGQLRQQKLEEMGRIHAQEVVCSLQTALQRKMAELGGGSAAEAKSYLEMADNDINEALKMYEEDLKWEREGGPATKFPGMPVRVEDTTRRKPSFLKRLLSGGSARAMQVC